MVNTMDNKNTILRNLPKLDKLITDNTFTGLNIEILKIASRSILDSLRDDIVKSDKPLPEHDKICELIKTEYNKIKKGTLYKIINATGVPIHTNLGRSPLPESVTKDAIEIACGYSNLEYDVSTGKRGDRYHHVADYLRILTGADDALIVNNNAAAVFLILNTFAKSKEVIVSRGELVEIGGSFRVPDVMSRSGAKLAEVGSTNKTRIQDYIDAVTPKTAMMMKVHKSNFEIVGFSEDAPLGDVALAAKNAGVLSYYDAGSGLFAKILPDSICEDQTMPDVMKTGFDIVSFSGDKMLGGPQAGIITGKKELIAKLKKNPLMRMFRVDKLTIALLQAIFRTYIEGESDTIPVNDMLSISIEKLHAKAEMLAKKLPCETKVISIQSTIGGGSCPTAQIQSYGVAINIKNKKPQQMEKMLRMHSTPVIARVTDDKLVMDVRTVSESEFETVKAAVENII